MKVSIPVLLFSLFFRKILAYYYPMSNYTREKFKNFREKLRESKSVLVITGAGMTNRGGMPTFEDVRDFWSYANLNAFEDAPSMVWEYFQLKRNFVSTIKPSKPFLELVKFEKRCQSENRKFTILTQNIDELHQRAGSKHVIELHGSIFRTKCTSCGDVRANYKNPICPSLGGIKMKESQSAEFVVPYSELPRCERYGCNGLLQPNVIGINEGIDVCLRESIEEAFKNCDICLLIGTSPTVSIAMELSSNKVKERRITVAGFNIEEVFPKPLYEFYFRGPIKEILEEALSM